MITATPITFSKSSKVHYSEYLRTENSPEEGTTNPPKPSEPAKPEKE